MSKKGYGCMEVKVTCKGCDRFYCWTHFSSLDREVTFDDLIRKCIDMYACDHDKFVEQYENGELL